MNNLIDQDLLTKIFNEQLQLHEGHPQRYAYQYYPYNLFILFGSRAHLSDWHEQLTVTLESKSLDSQQKFHIGQILIIIDLFMPYMEEMCPNLIKANNPELRLQNPTLQLQAQNMNYLYGRVGLDLVYHFYELVKPIYNDMTVLKQELESLYGQWYTPFQIFNHSFGMWEDITTSLRSKDGPLIVQLPERILPEIINIVNMLKSSPYAGTIQAASPGLLLRVGEIVEEDWWPWLTMRPDFQNNKYLSRIYAIYYLLWCDVPRESLQKFHKILQLFSTLEPVIYERESTNSYKVFIKEGDSLVLKHQIELNNFMDTRIDGKSILDM